MFYGTTFLCVLSTPASETEKQRYIVATGTVRMTSRAWSIYCPVLHRGPGAVLVIYPVLKLWRCLGALKWEEKSTESVDPCGQPQSWLRKSMVSALSLQGEHLLCSWSSPSPISYSSEALWPDAFSSHSFTDQGSLGSLSIPLLIPADAAETVAIRAVVTGVCGWMTT